MSTRTAPSETLERVARALDPIAYMTVTTRDGMPTIAVDRSNLAAVLELLKTKAGFEQATLVTAVDHAPAKPRFEVVHQLWSLSHVDRVRVKTRVDEHDAWVPTCVHLWPGASFMERECWDMFGVRFDGTPDPRRLLMPEEYGHHPLRKEFPHQGIEPDRLYRAWERERREEFFQRAAEEERE